MTQFPPYLKKGDTIGIMCPAGYLPKIKTDACVKTLKQWGYKVVLGKTVGGNSANYLSAPDNVRLKELQEMLDNKKIKAILFGRGGYGTSRIIDKIDYSSFLKKPKWLIGFSDITVLHNHLLSNFNIASLHAPMTSAFLEGGEKSESVQSLQKILRGEALTYLTKNHPFNKKGKAKGELVGGNLTLLCNIIGTPSDCSTKKRILFIEDIGEHYYSIDRMMTQLLRSDKLDKIKGLIVGGFTEMKDTSRPFGKNAEEIIRDIIAPYNIPVAYGFPVSHDKENVALKIGSSYQMEVNNKGCVLEEKKK